MYPQNKCLLFVSNYTLNTNHKYHARGEKKNGQRDVLMSAAYCF